MGCKNFFRCPAELVEAIAQGDTHPRVPDYIDYDRYVVVPVVDGRGSTVDDPLPVPTGLVDVLGAQLDLVRSVTPPSSVPRNRLTSRFPWSIRRTLPCRSSG